MVTAFPSAGSFSLRESLAAPLVLRTELLARAAEKSGPGNLKPGLDRRLSYSSIAPLHKESRGHLAQAEIFLKARLGKYDAAGYLKTRSMVSGAEKRQGGSPSKGAKVKGIPKPKDVFAKLGTTLSISEMAAGARPLILTKRNTIAFRPEKRSSMLSMSLSMAEMF
jgi:hypothetical protein